MNEKKQGIVMGREGDKERERVREGQRREGERGWERVVREHGGWRNIEMMEGERKGGG